MYSQLLIIFIIVHLSLGVIKCAVSESCIKLINAVKSSDCELIESMLNDGIDANQHVIDPITYRQVPILWIAVKCRCVHVIKLLINKGASVNFKRFGRESEEFTTPLHMAILLSDSEMVELFLCSGADIYAYDGLGYTPFGFAKYLESNAHIIQLLEAAAKLK